jgi:uncharacterized SAM-binding protein YcdF (DUF218 family)
MYFFFSQLVQPYTLGMLIAAFGLIMLWRKRREQRRRLLLVTVPFAVLFLLSVPVVSHLVLGSLEWQYPPQEKRPSGAGAIVVLGGGILYPPVEGAKPEVDQSSMERCVQAAKLYHQGKPCPVVVSGASEVSEEGGPSCADVMKDFLLRLDVRPADILIEGASRTTYENAVESCKLLKERRITRIVLVTQAFHMPRAVRCFRKQGVEVVPSGCGYLATEMKFSAHIFLPNAGAALRCELAFHEWLGSLWYRLHGRG